MLPSMQPGADDLERSRRAIGEEPVAWRPATRGGETAASRWFATLGDGRSVFVKIAFTLDTASWIRDEHTFYAGHPGLAFTPTLLGWHDDGDRPVLVLEDLSEAAWPPPWDRAKVDAVLTSLGQVALTAHSSELPPISQSQFDDDGWPEIARERDAFLALGLCDAKWLDDHLDLMRAAAHSAEFGGDALLHMDVRSDNLCVRREGAVLVDWNFACVGNPRFDVAAWLPSLHAEGGPAPEAVVRPSPDMAAFAALLAGYFASHAARHAIAEAPHVRPLQLKQARTALPWAARALGVPEPVPGSPA
jgi:hypothetical protein